MDDSEALVLFSPVQDLPLRVALLSREILLRRSRVVSSVLA